MPIRYEESTRTFYLDGSGFSYVFRLAGGLWPVHLHYGAPLRRVEEDAVARLSPYRDGDFSLDELPLDRMPAECPVFGGADLRPGMLGMRCRDGAAPADFTYRSHEITSGRPPLPGLPFARGEGAETLKLTLEDRFSGLLVHLFYTIWPRDGILARSAAVENAGGAPAVLTRALSLALDFEGSDFRLLTESGAWARERDLFSRPLVPGDQGVSSLRGHSSAQAAPFFALLAPDAGEAYGEAYGFMLCYSGNFLASVHVGQDGNARALLGIHPEAFSWTLAPGETFQTPEAWLCYSPEGLSGMSLRFHRFFHAHVTPGPYARAPRPILVNNWEATYFGFDEEKLIRLAEAAKAAEIDLFVLDDGWFGRRDDDRSSLGDWTDDLRKLPRGLAGLSARVHALGLRFGLWVEPEMVSPDSDLYRAHPDWCVHAPGRPRLESRHQLVLDLTRAEVRDHVVSAVSDALSRGRVDYVKWDMNRSLSAVGSACLPPERAGEFYHRFMLGVYEILSRVTRAFPDVLFESCAGGGSRFDAGMMCFAPQAWTSDNTDAWARCRIQYATSLFFPPSCMGAHVSAVPNHQTGRVTPLAARAAAAMFGTYGYELDLCALPPETLDEIRALNRRVREWQDVLLYGDTQRLRSPFEGGEAAWMQVSPDRRRAAVTFVQALSVANAKPRLLRLRGLLSGARYRDEDTGIAYGGDELMARGLPLRAPAGDFTAQQFFLTAE